MEDDDEAIRPAETARDKRRDRRAGAAERAGMRTGLAKQFKQVLDTQVRRASEAERELEDLRGDERERERKAHGRSGTRPAPERQDSG